MVVATQTIDVEEIKTWLEWAGQRLLSLQLSSPAPRGPHVAWPEYADDKHTAYGYTGDRLRAATPTGREIALMDEILALPSLVANPTVRRIIHARSVVTPVSNRYVYSWTRIAFMLHSDRRRIMRLYQQGLAEIEKKTPEEKKYSINQTYLSLTNTC